MQVFLFRHFEKSFDNSNDPGLTSFGLSQAQRLCEKVMVEKILPTPSRLLVSPKKRAITSFGPLAKQLKIELAIRYDLDELRYDLHETSAERRKRVQTVIDELTAESNLEAGVAGLTYYLCSHADWVEDFLSLAPMDVVDPQSLSHWPSGHFESFVLHKGLWQHQFGGDT